MQLDCVRAAVLSSDGTVIMLSSVDMAAIITRTANPGALVTLVPVILKLAFNGLARLVPLKFQIKEPAGASFVS